MGAPPRRPRGRRRLARAKLIERFSILARGQTNPRIAQELVISPGTVKNHVRHILAKLDVSDRTQAAVRAVELGLLAQ